MNGKEARSKKFVTSVTVSEVLVSAGIQLLQLANDLAFTDAPYGEEWTLEAAVRMASLSEVLNVLYKRLDVATLGMTLDLPPGVIGEQKANPYFVPEAEEPDTKGAGSTEREGGSSPSISDIPF